MPRRWNVFIFNVLSNAFKFTPENGSIVVTLSAIAQADGKEYARLVVSDSGSGISVQHIRHIFDRFYQIDVNHAGSGIGLALTKAFWNCTEERLPWIAWRERERCLQ